MKNFFRLAIMITMGVLWALPSWAGSWALDRYEVLSNSTGQVHLYQPQSEDDYMPIRGTEKVTPDPENQNYPDHQIVAANQLPTAGAKLSYSGRIFQEYPAFDLSAGDASCTMTVVPVFKWQSDGENDKPSDEFWIWESGTAGVVYTHWYQGAGYSEENRYEGQNFEKGDLNTGLDGGQDQITRDYPDYYYAPKGRRAQDKKSRTAPKRISSGGATEVYGPSRTLSASVKSSGWNTKQLGQDYYGAAPHAYADAYVQYSAGVTDFVFNATASEFSRPYNGLLKKEINAYAGQSETGDQMLGKPVYNWNGSASYDIQLSSGMLGTIGSPTYHWNTGGTWADGSQSNDKTSISSTYNFGSGDVLESAPHVTNAQVIVEGNNVESGLLTANAKINWYEAPSTEYRVEAEVVGIDLDDGQEVVLSGGEDDDPDQELIDALNEANEELRTTIDAGAQITGTGLEIAGSFVTPDAVDLIPFGAGFKRIYKVGDGGLRMIKVVSTLRQNVNKRGDALKAAARLKRGKGADHPMVIRVKTRAFPTTRRGKLPPNSERAPTPKVEQERVAEETGFLGDFCFVPGTLVQTERGPRVIESLKAGDLVWAKNESSGEVALRPITQTFERVAPGTLVLSFANGEKIETTIEHPFYVQDKGFTPAGLVAIGNSIVTRAGPSSEVVGVEKHDSPHRVYNFEVAEFHSYFVGNAALWVHNANYPAFGAAFQKLQEVKGSWKSQYPGVAEPGMVGAIEIPGVGTFTGFSNNVGAWARARKAGQNPPSWTPNSDVVKLYDRLIPNMADRGSNHAKCAETLALSKIFNELAGQGLSASQIETQLKASGGTSSAIKTETSRLNGPCKSCRKVLQHLNLKFF